MPLGKKDDNNYNSVFMSSNFSFFFQIEHENVSFIFKNKVLADRKAE